MAKQKSTFYQDIYDVVRMIPKGRVTSYGAVAESLGQKEHSRRVGYALNKCPSDVPAHRVVNRNGLLTGKNNFGLENQMQKLLEAEGIKILKDKVQNFDKVFWNPSTELLEDE